MVIKPPLSTGVRALSLVFVLSCSEASQDPGSTSPTGPAGAQGVIGSQSVPQELASGEEKFNSYCSRCHGSEGKGTEQGPPLVHKIYEPNHHGDFAFQRAAGQGVRAHHWKFGNMPKIDGVTPEDVNEIIHYVRWLQRQAGIF
jgi:mono/diheme cytochrome c family protein